MNLSIEQNDAFRTLSRTTGVPESELTQIIVQAHIETGWTLHACDDWGWTVNEIAENNGVEINEVIRKIFPEVLWETPKSHLIINTEIPELLKAIVFCKDHEESKNE